MTARLIQLLFAFAPTVIACSADCQVVHVQSHYVPVTLCELSFHNERTNPKHISVEAEYVSGIPHGLVLIDRRCKEKGLGIDFGNTGLDPSVAFIKRHLFEIHRANGTFRGTLKRDRESGRLYLWLESVVDFRSDDIQDVDKPIYLPESPLIWPPKP